MTTQHKLEDFFPSYLTDAEQKALKESLQIFNDSSQLPRMLISPTDTDLLQGDCIHGLNMYDYTKNKLIPDARVMVISNSCDIDINNPRPNLPLDCVVAPILDLDKIYNGLTKNGTVNLKRVNNFIDNIQNNRLTNTFFLRLDGSSRGFAVFFDKAFSVPLNIISSTTQVFKSLNMFGFYFLIFKLSVNFCRLHEKVHRPM